MKPYVICHMVASIDGRILHSRWRPRTFAGGDLFERLLRAPIAQMSLESCEVLDSGAVWLRYRVRNDGTPVSDNAS